MIEKFRALLLEESYSEYLDASPLVRGNCAYVTEIIGKNINLYVTTPALLPHLSEQIRQRRGNNALCFLVLRGVLGYRGKRFQLRIGAYGVPCSKLTTSVLGLLNEKTWKRLGV